MKGRIVATTVAGLGLLLASLVCAGPLPARAVEQPAAPQADFNRDYYGDLVIGVPWDHPGGVSDAGAINVAYGRSTGLSKSYVQHLNQDIPGTEDAAEVNDYFAYALAVGDFDGNGHFDVAVGVPGEDVGGDAQAGAVHVLYGQPAGVHWHGDQLWHQDVGTVQSITEPGDQFGQALAAGDFNRDGYDDLAVGVPMEDWNLQDSGIVQILYGSPTGLSDLFNQLYRQGYGGLPETEEISDEFGKSLAVGDFDDDGYDDLAIGVEGEDLAGPARENAGVVHVLYGGGGGLSTVDNSLWSQDRSDMLDAAEQYDYFGQALTTGDFDGDGYDDLAVGVTGEDSLGVIGAGAVHILEGGSAGLTVNGNQLLENHMTGNQYMAHYGSALAASDFDGDGFVDLAIGVPNYDLEISVSFDCGGVKVVYGTDDGLSTSRSQLWVQSAAWGLGEGVEQDDHFGASLAAGDFDGDGYADLAIGVPDEDVVYASTTRENAGYVNTLYGSQIGIRSAGVQGWHQDGVLVEDAPGAHERFGYALAAYPGTFHRIHLPIVLRND